MKIRNATTNDVESIAALLMLVLENMVYKFIGEKDYEKAREFLVYFLKKKQNQYSFENCFVAESSTEIIGVINIYNGSNLTVLRQPILEHSNRNYNITLPIEDETQAGEYYIDTLAVHGKWQGKGIGTKLLQHAIDTYVVKKKETLGLLVNENNPNAKKLYLNLGFESVGKKNLLGHSMEHLQIQSSPHNTNQ